MTLAGLLQRFNHFRERLPILWRGLPQGCCAFVDINRRLTKTPIEIIFDVGANRGQSAEEFKRWYPRATIHCFEPVAETFSALEKVAGRLRAVHAHKIGFSDVVGRQVIGLSKYDSMSKIGAETGVGEEIYLQSLDSFCAQQRVSSLDYLKIDTEGHDLQVLKGGASLLASGNATIIQVEAGLNPDNEFHASAESLTEYLREYQYRLFGIYEQTLQWPTADAYLRRANLVFVSADTVRRNHWID